MHGIYVRMYYYACIATKRRYASSVCELHSNQNNRRSWNKRWCMHLYFSRGITFRFRIYLPLNLHLRRVLIYLRIYCNISLATDGSSIFEQRKLDLADNPSNVKTLPYMAGNRTVRFILEFHECSSLPGDPPRWYLQILHNRRDCSIIINARLITNICDNANLSIKPLFNVSSVNVRIMASLFANIYKSEI